MTEFKCGEHVKLKKGYLLELKTSVQEQFSGRLTVVGVFDNMLRLSNGNSAGLCFITCTASNIEKID